MDELLLQAEGLGMTYGRRQVLTDISLSLRSGQTLGVIGESGCGKSTLARLLIGLELPTRGRVLWRGQDLWTMNRPERKASQKEVQMIFQNPYAALNPAKTVLESVMDGLVIQKTGNKKQRAARAEEVLAQVSLSEDSFHRIPADFSGGELQRVCIARALALRPRVLICDEPTSSLDVSIQAQIANLLVRLQKSEGLSMIFISHDLRLVRYMSDCIAVLHAGQLVEYGPTQEICGTPSHPYTRLLLEKIHKEEDIML